MYIDYIVVSKVCPKFSPFKHGEIIWWLIIWSIFGLQHVFSNRFGWFNHELQWKCHNFTALFWVQPPGMNRFSRVKLVPKPWEKPHLGDKAAMELYKGGTNGISRSLQAASTCDSVDVMGGRGGCVPGVVYTCDIYMKILFNVGNVLFGEHIFLKHIFTDILI